MATEWSQRLTLVEGARVTRQWQLRVQGL